MKKNLLITTSLAAILLMSCGGKQKQTVNEAPVQSSEVYEMPVNDEHNAKNSLDYIGSYKGEVQLEGIGIVNLSVVLSDSTYSYHRTVNNHPAGTRIEYEGRYTWDETGFIVTLEGVDLPKQYKVVENALITLDNLGEIDEEKIPQNRLEKIE